VLGPVSMDLNLEWPGHEVDLSPPSSADVRNERNCTSSASICVWGVPWDDLHTLHFPFCILKGLPYHSWCSNC